jgi:hypothetical protein
MRRLIEKGADVNAKTYSRSPHSIVLRDPKEQARHSFQTNEGEGVMSMQVAYGALNHNITPLLLAAASGSSLAVELLLSRGADPKVATVSGETPLDAASANGSLRAVRLLLDKGAHIESRDMLSTTPLVSAVINGQASVVRELLKRGADPSPRWRAMTLIQVAQMFRRNDIAAMLARAPKTQPKKAAVAQTQMPSATKPAPQRNSVTIHHSSGAVEVVR